MRTEKITKRKYELLFAGIYELKEAAIAMLDGISLLHEKDAMLGRQLQLRQAASMPIEQALIAAANLLHWLDEAGDRNSASDAYDRWMRLRKEQGNDGSN